MPNFFKAPLYNKRDPAQLDTVSSYLHLRLGLFHFIRNVKRRAYFYLTCFNFCTCS